MYAGLAKEEWLAKRASGIGGSEAAAVLGLSPWETAVSVWLRKTGRAAPKEETEAMRIGTELEDLVARRYTEETGREVRNHNSMLTDGCLLGNIDRLVIPAGKKSAAYKGVITTDRLLECKTATREWEDGVPLYYQVQVQHYMGLAPSVQRADVACLFLLRKHFEVHTVERDDEAIKDMQEYLRAWWEKHIVKGEIPQPTCESDVKQLYKRSNPGKTITANEELARTVEKYKRLKEQIDRRTELLNMRREQIILAMRDAEFIAAADGKPLVSWKSGKPTQKTDWKSLAVSLNPTKEQIAEFTREDAGIRRFLVK